ncbi:MAG: carboxypeptidase-like regulatory domain-containing protein [Bryobacteraceae bacterium]
MQRVLAPIVALFILTVQVWGQASSSTVRGTVYDSANAVVPKANVTLTNTATNVARTTTTNDAGIYVFPGVIPGPHLVVIEFAGMQKFEGNLTVRTQQDAVVDAVLQVGQTATRVEVQDVTPLVRVDSPTLGHALERQRIEQLPINGRGYQAFLATVPGIDSTGIPQAYGMRTNTSTTVFDGAPYNEIWEGWDFGRPPGLDAIQEIQVELNNSSAKFTRPATIILSSRSGTNELHGAVFETNRNSGYGVARRRQDFFTKPPFLNRNEFGASLGGPVVIPGVYNGRNRTFFFFAWESARSRSYTTNQYSFPTAAMRQGDFRELVDAQGRQINLYDPFTTDRTTFQRQPLTYRGAANTMDPARITPLAKFFFDLTPLPNQPGVNPLLGPNWIGPTLVPNEQNTYSIRGDHRFSGNDLIFARFTYGQNDHWLGNTVLLPISIGTFPKAAAASNRHWPNHSGAFTWVHTFSANMTNELLVNATRDFHRRGSGDFQTNYAAALGLPNPFNAPNWPAISGTDLPGNWPFGSAGLFHLITNYGMIQDNATRIVGKHEFQFGFQVRHELIEKSSDSLAGGFDAGTLATSLYDPASTPSNPIARPQTGYGLANFALGVMNYSATFRRPWFHFRRQEYSSYFHDNWKVTPRLNISLGLRWEMRTPIYDRDDTLLTFSLDKRALVVGTNDVDTFVKRGVTLPSILSAMRGFGANVITYKEAGLPQRLVYYNWKQLGPRLGFAYRAADGQKAFVVRGGYRVSYYPQKLQDWVGSQSSSTPVGATFTNSVTNTALSPDGLPSYGLRTVPVYTAGVNTPSSIIDTTDTRLLARGFNARFIDPHHADGRVQDWNLTFEKEVMPNTVARIAYVGNYGDRQQQWTYYNESTPDYIWYVTRKEPLPTGPFANVARRPYDSTTYGSIDLFDASGYGRYNGVQFELERRYANGFGFQTFWVIGNTILVNRDTDGTQAADAISALNQFLPGAVPSDPKERNHFLNYKRDPNTPKHQFRWNFIYDLPFGRGKKFAGSANKVLDKFIGGWQVAGLGNIRSNYWSLPTNVYPVNGRNIEVYGYKYPIQDCRSGACTPGYLWWNGYIPSNRINSVDAQGRPNGVMGVPADYKPAAEFLIPAGSTALPPNAPAGTVVSQFWETNNVWVPLNNGTVQRLAFNDNMHPWRNQYLPGVLQWFQDASLFKFISIKERLALRFNMDFFNVFNHPNNPNAIGGDGILATRNSGSGARVMQLGLRLSW